MKVIARSLVVIFVAVIAVPALAVTQTITTAVQLLATTVLMMGGTGTPLAPTTPVENQTYMDTMLNGFFVQDGYTRQAVHTPEEFWPSQLDHLTFDQSVAQGVVDIDEAIKSADYSDGNKVIVFGYSQSARIVAIEKQNLASDLSAPDPSQLEFVVIGSTNNPDGGILTRLPGLVIPVLGITFEPAMPNDDYVTTSYIREFDAVADMPDNPFNLLALGNALVGGLVVHGDYRVVDPDDPNDPDDTYSPYTTLPTTPGSKSVYILVHTERLPILMIFNGIVPEPILAGLDPILRWGVNLAYDRTTPADVPTPFTILPTFNPITAASDLGDAIVEGFGAAAGATAIPAAAPFGSTSDRTLARAGSEPSAPVENKVEENPQPAAPADVVTPDPVVAEGHERRRKGLSGNQAAPASGSAARPDRVRPAEATERIAPQW